MAPDVDFFWALATGTESFLCRRMLTHSLPGLPLVAAASAGVVKLFARAVPWTSLFGLAFLGAAGHLFLDLVNSYGVVLLYPFSRERFELSWIFIIDLVLTGFLAAPVILGLFPWAWGRSERAGRVFLAAAAAWILLCAAGERRAMALLARAATKEEGKGAPENLCVFPEPFGPHRFRGVAFVGDAWEEWMIRPLAGACERIGRHETATADPVVEAARATPRGRELEWFFRAPVWRVVSADEAEVYDLRFRSAVLVRDAAPFTYRVRTAP